MDKIKLKKIIRQGIPQILPALKKYNKKINHAPKRTNILNKEEKKLALKNALRYFPSSMHSQLIKEFKKELLSYGRIYMYRFMPDYKIHARKISDYPHKSKQAAAIMLMLSNNLDHNVAQHPEELITYGGNGSVFSNWAQYLLTMQYLSIMTNNQTLVLSSGHPLGLFPSHENSPRLIITNGMMIPNYSSRDEYEKYNALGVTSYGQMTAGSFMYIGPQGIIHGTTITILNILRKIKNKSNQSKRKIFISSGLGGMSGAQAKAAVITGCIGVIAEINPKVIKIRYEQGWIDEVFKDLDLLIKRIKEVRKNDEVVSLAYQGNIVDLLAKIISSSIYIDIGSDQTSLHNPWNGGYYPMNLSFAEANKLMSSNPKLFKEKVQETLRKHVDLINILSKKGMYFFDYGNAFLLEASKANAKVMKSKKDFKYPSYVQEIMGPLCFDYGFGPFRWVCASNEKKDLAKTDLIAKKVLKKLLKISPPKIQQQLTDNIKWIEEAEKNNLIVGSMARILYANSDGRIGIALAFNKAIKEGKITHPIILGRDHHDVSGTDSPYRETSNIYDGSQFTADMSIQSFIGNSFRGATWVSLHNGGGVGWGEVINGGFGLVLDGSKECDKKIKSMLFWDVNNGISRRSWARNSGAIESIKTAMEKEPLLKVTLPNLVDPKLL